MFAQGLVLFNNSALTKVQLQDSLGVKTDAPAGTTYTVGLWWAPSGTTDANSAAWQYSGISTTIGPTPGRFTGGSQTLAAMTAGATIAVQIRGWQTDAGSYDAAASGGKYSGKASIFEMTPGNPLASPPGTAKAIVFTGPPAGFQGLTLQVPEPSTIALGILGLGGLFLLRRRS